MKPGEDNYELKLKFLDYFRRLPNQALAADKIGRSDDTISLWKKDDSDFSDQITEAKADWAMKKTDRVKDEKWLLERLLNDHFGEKKNIDLTSKGKAIPILGGITNVPSDNGDQQTSET